MTALSKLTKAQLIARVRELESEPARLRSELAGKKVEIDRLAGELFQKRADDNATAIGAQRIRITELEEEVENGVRSLLNQADVITSQRAEIYRLKTQIEQLTRPPLLTRLRRWLAAGIAPFLLLTACAFEPENAIPMTPPESYRAVWAEVEACTGRTGDMDGIEFFKVPGDSFIGSSGEPAAGHSSHGRVFISESYLDHPMVVKHELIHAIGVDGHPKHPFESPCAATWDTWDYTADRLAL